MRQLKTQNKRAEILADKTGSKLGGKLIKAQLGYSRLPDKIRHQ